MKLLETALSRFGFEKRSRDPYTQMHHSLRDSGQDQSPTGIPAVHACVQLIAETIASLPLSLYRKLPDGGREVMSDHPLHEVLHHQANRVQTAMEFREQFVASCLLTGNGYAHPTLNGAGEVIELTPVSPSDLAPEKLVNGRVRYRKSGTSGTEFYLQDEMLHLRYRTSDGFTGISPIAIARATIRTASAQQTHEAAFYENGARPAGILTMDGVLNHNQRTSLSQSWMDKHSGVQNHNKLLVLEGGMKFEPISISSKDAEYVESRRLNMEDIARIFKVPPPMIGMLENATYSNISEQSRMLVMHTLRPWLVRIEQAMNASLLTPESRRTMFIEHNADGLLRGS